MIRKPPGAEQESKAHAAVGRAIEIGGDVRDASKKGGRILGKGCGIYLVVVMAFGLLMSNTPWWFKGLVLLLGYGAYRLVRSAAKRFQFEADDEARARENFTRSINPLSGFHDGSAF